MKHERRNFERWVVCPVCQEADHAGAGSTPTSSHSGIAVCDSCSAEGQRRWGALGNVYMYAETGKGMVIVPREGVTIEAVAAILGLDELDLPSWAVERMYRFLDGMFHLTGREAMARPNLVSVAPELLDKLRDAR